MANQHENESKVKVHDNALVVNEGEGGAGDADDATFTDSSRKSEKLYQSDQLYLRKLLPDEVWRDILFLLKDPDDFLSCVNSSPYFWELEREERVVFLFPKVMEVLAFRYEPREFEVQREEVKSDESGVVEGKTQNEITLNGLNSQNQVAQVEMKNDENEKADEVGIDVNDTESEEDEEGEGSDGSEDEEDENTRRKENIHEEWRRTIFNCRLVCSTWNQAMEKIYAAPLMTGIREYVKDLDPRSLENTMYVERAKWKVSIWDLDSAQRFLQHFEQSHHSGATATAKNPIFGRYVSLNINEHWQGTENFQEYQKTLTKILTMFGHHIWYCNVTLGTFSTNLEERYLQLREWLGLMPNLKFIRMNGPSLFGYLPVGIFQRSPLPVLEKLDNVILWGTAGPLVTELLQRNGSRLSYLKMRQIDDVDVDSVGGLLSNLQSFSSEYCKSGDAILEKFASGWKKLNKLDLFKSQGFKPTFDFLQSVNFSSEVLIDLRLQYCEFSILEESKALRLDLPNLLRLHLWISGTFSLDFALLLTKSLEHLNISSFIPREVEEQIVEFAGFENRLQESNIWKLFGKLKTIKMGSGYNGEGFIVYTREGNKFVYES